MASTVPRPLRAEDEWPHRLGTQTNWSESRYADFCDLGSGVSGWMRHGMRVNEGAAEVTVCLHLPRGEVAFGYARVPVTGNGMAAGGLAWTIRAPYREVAVGYEGELVLLPDGLALANRDWAAAPRVRAALSLTLTGGGLGTVLGADQRELDGVFLPGQADGHYQQLVSVTGTVRVGAESFAVVGVGGRDHSWGPRDWHAKHWFRWLVGTVGAGSGFMLTRAVGSAARTAGGMVWTDGHRETVDRLEVRTRYAAGLPAQTVARFGAGDRTWTATGTALGTVPLRHRRVRPDGGYDLLRIAKSPVRWTLDDGRVGTGITEHHDLMRDGVPMGAPE